MDRSLLDWSRRYEDTEACNSEIVDTFRQFVNETPALKEHRDFVERHVYGFGDRAFHWLWKLIIDEVPNDFAFLEIGVYKGQILSLVRLLADSLGKDVFPIGITPLSSFAGLNTQPFPETDYMQHIKDLHNEFGLEFGEWEIICADSTSDEAKEEAAGLGEFDVVYIDGCHEYAYVRQDLEFYPGLVPPGGFLVIDDASCFLHMPWGYFTGIQDVAQAVRDIIEPDPRWKQVLVVMHNRVFQRSED